jgi:hypothetical protein
MRSRTASRSRPVATLVFTERNANSIGIIRY